MRFDVPLAFTDAALSPFRDALADASRSAADGGAELIEDARAAHARMRAEGLPAWLRPHLDQVPRIADLLADREWQIHADSHRALAGALAYFCEPADLIPDASGGFGLLDDAIVIGLALESERLEWAAWQDYRRFRDVHGGIGPVDRERWLRLRGHPAGSGHAGGRHAAGRYSNRDQRSRYLLLDALPRLDLH